MKNLPVHWSEGMFLRPHHFQAADRFWTEQLDASERWDHPYNYGVRDLELSPAAIENFQVEVTSCKARMRDGTLISIEPNAGRFPRSGEPVILYHDMRSGHAGGRTTAGSIELAVRELEFLWRKVRGE